ncbi:MAG: S-layer homology domain-containing protein [Clostridiales bacterium]|jgi:hypothetical protein|nr:S-layer homology domain-containing protein [Clostridiales bacterium]
MEKVKKSIKKVKRSISLMLAFVLVFAASFGTANVVAKAAPLPVSMDFSQKVSEDIYFGNIVKWNDTYLSIADFEWNALTSGPALFAADGGDLDVWQSVYYSGSPAQIAFNDDLIVVVTQNQAHYSTDATVWNVFSLPDAFTSQSAISAVYDYDGKFAFPVISASGKLALLETSNLESFSEVELPLIDGEEAIVKYLQSFDGDLYYTRRTSATLREVFSISPNALSSGWTRLGVYLASGSGDEAAKIRWDSSGNPVVLISSSEESSSWATSSNWTNWSDISAEDVPPPESIKSSSLSTDSSIASYVGKKIAPNGYTIESEDGSVFNPHIYWGETLINPMPEIITTERDVDNYIAVKNVPYSLFVEVDEELIDLDSTTITFEVKEGSGGPTDIPLAPDAVATVPYNGHLYGVYDTVMDWRQAKSYCESIGGHLITITSQDEQDFFNDTLADLTSRELHWVGATDEVEEGVWKWVSGEPFDYSNWLRGQPDDSWEDENFINLIAKDTYWYSQEVGKWIDVIVRGNINTDISFVCEWDEIPSSIPGSPGTFDTSGSSGGQNGGAAIDSNLPEGLELNPATGEIFGIPKRVEKRRVNISATFENAAGTFVTTKTFDISVLENADSIVESASDPGYEFVTPEPEETVPQLTGTITTIEDHVLLSIGEYDEFTNLYIDGVLQRLDTDYSISRGSTRIVIKGETIGRVGEGTHTIAATFTNTDTGRPVMKRAAMNYHLDLGSDSSSGSASYNNMYYSAPTTQAPLSTTIVASVKGGTATATIRALLLKQAADDGEAITITSTLGNFLIDPAAVKEIGHTTDVVATYSVELSGVGGLLLSATLDRKGAEITTFGKGIITLAIPYTLPNNVRGTQVVPYYSNNGKLSVVMGGYNAEKKNVELFLRHLSDYVVKVNDLQYEGSGGWYDASLDWAAQRGLIDRFVVNGQINAAQNVTREDFVVALLKSLGIEPLDSFKVGQFSDVSGENAEYIRTARQLGIIDGVGNNLFAPEVTSKRGEQFQIAYNLIQANFSSVEGQGANKKLSDFNDAASVPNWLKPALTELVKLGVVQGDGANLNVGDNFTVGQACSVLQRMASPKAAA